jgi:hypothetical protein
MSSDPDPRPEKSPALARRALLTAAAFTMVGAGLGVVGMWVGTVTGIEAVLIFSCLLFHDRHHLLFALSVRGRDEFRAGIHPAPQPVYLPHLVFSSRGL